MVLNVRSDKRGQRLIKFRMCGIDTLAQNRRQSRSFGGAKHLHLRRQVGSLLLESHGSLPAARLGWNALNGCCDRQVVRLFGLRQVSIIDVVARGPRCV